MSSFTSEEVAKHSGRLPLGRQASLGDSLLAPFFGGMMIGFIGFLVIVFAGETIRWQNPNLPFYAYVVIWAVAGVWIWARGVWLYVRQLEATIVAGKLKEL